MIRFTEDPPQWVLPDLCKLWLSIYISEKWTIIKDLPSVKLGNSDIEFTIQ